MPSARKVSVGTATLIVGALLGGLATSVLNRVPSGSVVTDGGNVQIVTANRTTGSVNSNPSFCVDSGCLITVKRTKLALSGSNVMTASVLTPSIYASGSYIREIRVMTNNAVAVMSGSLGIFPQLKAQLSTASKIYFNRTSAAVLSGGLLRVHPNENFGNTSGNALISSGSKVAMANYVTFMTATGSAARLVGLDSYLEVEFGEKYGR